MIPDNVCFIDLETLPEDACVGMDPGCAPGWTPTPIDQLVAEPGRRTCPTSYRKSQTIDAWEARESERYSTAVREAWLAAHDAQEIERAKGREEWAKGSLNPLRGRVACISVAFGEGDVDVIECAEDEASGLRELSGRIGGARVFVAHYGIGFDFPFLQVRAMRHGGLRLARALHQDKPWDGRLVDTKDWWPVVGRKGARLVDCCALLGIDHSEGNPIDGSEVLDAYISGRWQEVVEHARADVRDLREVYRVLAQVRGEL